MKWQAQRQRANKGNTFVHFTIRAIQAGQTARARGHRVFSVLEHPEDLGMTPRGEPASIWQLPELRKAFGKARFWTVAGHQCQFGVGRKKPTRLFSDILSFADFGLVGWPKFDSRGFYVGPIPKDGGHTHRQQMIGRSKNGELSNCPGIRMDPNPKTSNQHTWSRTPLALEPVSVT